MMLTLILLALAQVTTPNSMNLNGQAPTRFSCDGGITCTRAGSTLTITGSPSAGSAPTVTCATDEALTWNGSAWACISKIRAAWSADAGITAQYLPITCGAGEFVTCNGSSCSCSTPAGGSSGPLPSFGGF